MSTLSDADRNIASVRLQKYLSSIRESLGSVTRADIKAAIDGLDNYIDTNGAGINSAIPQPARAQLSTRQKALLLAYVCIRRSEVA